MYALIALAATLTCLMALMRLGIKLGRAMLLSALLLILLLGVTPKELLDSLIREWHDKPISQTTPLLWLSLTALALLVNILGEAMQETGVSQRLVPALQAIFRSRRFALCAVPMIMGLLPTPGGIMLSAPMVRDLGDALGVERKHQAAINFLFRHQWESVWPLYPSIPLIQGMFGISAFALLSHNLVLTGAGLLGSAVFLLWSALPKKNQRPKDRKHFREHLKNFSHALAPIAIVTGLYVAFDLPPALGLLFVLFVFLLIHRVPFRHWIPLVKRGLQWDFALLIFGALLCKLTVQAGGAVDSVVTFFQSHQVPPLVIAFTLPFIVSALTGLSLATVAMTFPFLMPFIGTGPEARIGLQTLGFAGIICGLMLSPVHLCVFLSCVYFKCSLAELLRILIPPAIVIAGTGVVMALLF